MAYDSTIRGRVSQAFAAQKQANKQMREQRVQEIYQKIPHVQALDSSVSQNIMSMMQQLRYVASEAEVAEIKNKIEAENVAYISEKQTLLKAAGYPVDYLDPVYACPVCLDEGIVDGVPCDCYRRALIREAYRASNLSSMTECSFDKFSLDYYPKETDKEGISSYDSMKALLKRAERFAENFGSEEANLLFYGMPGLGKTFLSSCIANAVIAKGYTVIYQTANELFSCLEAVRFGREISEKNQYILDRLTEAELLIIDDLGTELVNDYSVAELFRIMNSRLISHRSTIINTNMSVQDLRSCYTDRVASRMIGHYELYAFRGNDIRLQKKYQNI